MTASETPRCKQCGGLIEIERHLWATPVCFACVPPHRKPRQAACSPPTHHAFDIDIYDCPCGHMYGDHDYNWLGTAVHPEKAMVIVRCETCDAATRFVAPEQNQQLEDAVGGQGKPKAPGGKSSEAPGKSVPRG